MKTKAIKRERRHRKIRSKIFGVAQKPRLSIFKSNKFISAQIIDDEKAITLASSSTKDMKGKTLILRSKEAGIVLAKKATEKNITTVVFDRGGFIFTGAVKAFADGAREGGLKF